VLIGLEDGLLVSCGFQLAAPSQTLIASKIPAAIYRKSMWHAGRVVDPKVEAADTGLLSPDLAAGIRRVKGAKKIGVRLGMAVSGAEPIPSANLDAEGVKGRRDRAILALLLEGRVFRCVIRKGSTWGNDITEKVIWHVVKNSAANAGIAKLSPHDCRRTGANAVPYPGGELEQIQFLLGHVSVETTERYLGCKQHIRGAVNDKIGLIPRETYSSGSPFTSAFMTLTAWIPGHRRPLFPERHFRPFGRLRLSFLLMSPLRRVLSLNLRGSPGNGFHPLISPTACGSSSSRRTGENTSHIVESRTPIAPISSARRIPTPCAMAPPASAPNGRTPWKSRCTDALTRPRRLFGVIACRKLRALMV
jgi:hypothetical protein